MAYNDSTKQYQRMLASYTRTGIETAIPGTKEEGIMRYRTMIYTIVNESLSTSYPLTRQLLTAQEWDDTVHRYFSTHACTSPYLWRMPLEFYEYIQEEQSALLIKYPCLSDLLLFEWVEIEVFMMEDEEVLHKTEGAVETDALVLNPACAVQYFKYPVYAKPAAEITPADAAHYFMLTHRNPETGNVAFLEIAPMFARMFEWLTEEAMSVDQLISRFTEESQLALAADSRINIVSFFKNCLSKRIILGFN